MTYFPEILRGIMIHVDEITISIQAGHHYYSKPRFNYLSLDKYSEFEIGIVKRNNNQQSLCSYEEINWFLGIASIPLEPYVEERVLDTVPTIMAFVPKKVLMKLLTEFCIQELPTIRGTEIWTKWKSAKPGERTDLCL